MDTLADADAYLFDGFRLDRQGLSRSDDHGCFVPVPLGSRALEVLAVLVSRSGDLVARDDIMNLVWPGVVVESSNLPVQIAALRRVLDDGRAESSCIQNVPGRGYRFVAPVMRTNSADPPVALLPSGNGVDEHITVDERLLGRPSVPARPDEPASQASRWRPRRGVIAGTIGILFLVAAGVVGWHFRSSRSDETRSAPRMSIVVLPFASLSNDTNQQYFADGVTGDLTTNLSQIEHMLVIAHTSAVIYRNKPVSASEIGRELNVRYILEGSVQRAGDRIRVNAQLINAETNTHLWADRFDGNTSDLFDLQEEITRRIAQALNGELIAVEATRPNEHPDALDYILRGRAAADEEWTRDNYVRAIGFFEQALAFNSHSAEAEGRLANVLINRILREQTETPAADIARAGELIERALTASPGDPFAHYVKGKILRIEGRCPEAIPEFERAIASNPNFAAAYGDLGRCKFLTGSIDEVISLEEQALRRLSPRDPVIGTFYYRIGTVHLLESRTDEAIAWFRKALLVPRSNARLRDVHLFLASAYALKAEPERAAFELTEARRLSEADRLSIAWMKTNLSKPEPSWAYAVPRIRALYQTTFFAGLRKAGIPEE